MVSASLEKLFCMSAASCRSPHPQPFSTPCREKASWALSFHLCRPPPAPLQNEGHSECRSSLHPAQLFLLQGHVLFSAVRVGPTTTAPQPSADRGASCLFRTVAASIYPHHPSPPSGMEFPPALPSSIVCVSRSYPICRVKELTKSFFYPCKLISATCNHLQWIWHCSLSIHLHELLLTSLKGQESNFSACRIC